MQQQGVDNAMGLAAAAAAPTDCVAATEKGWLWHATHDVYDMRAYCTGGTRVFSQKNVEVGATLAFKLNAAGVHAIDSPNPFIQGLVLSIDGSCAQCQVGQRTATFTLRDATNCKPPSRERANPPATGKSPSAALGAAPPRRKRNTLRPHPGRPQPSRRRCPTPCSTRFRTCTLVHRSTSLS